MGMGWPMHRYLGALLDLEVARASMLQVALPLVPSYPTLLTTCYLERPHGRTRLLVLPTSRVRSSARALTNQRAHILYFTIQLVCGMV
mgnify:CR=1 FL=1|jgi:hypothetical protein